MFSPTGAGVPTCLELDLRYETVLRVEVRTWTLKLAQKPNEGSSEARSDFRELSQRNSWLLLITSVA